MPSVRLTIGLLMSLCTSFTSGCGTMQAYAGDRLPENEVAIIKSGFKFGDRAELIGVDGSELDFGTDKVEVLPGSHTVAARAIGQHGNATLYSNVMTLELEAEAAHTYELYAEYLGGGWFKAPTAFTIWIEDKESREVVAGRKPSAE